MATEEDTEAGGQTDDSDAGGDEPADTGGDEDTDKQTAREDGDKPTGTRKERRANRMRESNEARDAAIRESAELRQRVQAAEAAAQEAHRRIEDRERQSQATGEVTRKKERIAAIRRNAKLHLARSAQLQGVESEKEWDEFQRLNDEADDLRDELRDADRWEKRKGEIAGQMPNQQMAEEKQYLAAKYPWLRTHVEGRSLADGRFNALVGAGRQPSMQTMEEAITYAAKTLRIGGGSAPGAASRSAYVGMGQRDGEADEGAPTGTMTAEDVRNNLPLKRMALQLYNQLDEQDAYAKFAKDIGTKALRERA